MNVIPSDSAEAPEAVEAPPPRSSEAVSVVAVVTVVAGVDPQPTLEAVAGQDHAPTAIRLVGADVEDAPSGVVLSEDMEAVVAELDNTVEYVWILHGDAQPRPDALRALVSEADRFEASLAGSKLLIGGTADTLESVGSATDVFGEPYSGLDRGEVDLEQYDVVRDVAFVSSVSMLVRRDLLRGLRGLDPKLAPVAAGLDLSQRVRVAGGRVIVVPSSEVFHQRRCGRGDGGWREQAGRMRAMLKSYRPITLAWMLPFAFFVGIVDALGSVLLGRWRTGPRYALTWGWNLLQFPSTLALRRNIARVRQVGDEEVFRYQVQGSVRLRQVGSELSERLLTVFDEGSPVTRRANEVWNSPATWGVLISVLVVLVGLRSIFLGGLPVVGHALTFPDPTAAFQWFLEGWNPAGLGSSTPIHPSAVPAAVMQYLTFGNEVVARSVLTLVAFLGAVIGVGRLAGRLGIAGPGAYVGGVAALFGLPASILAGAGRWSALVAIGILPWALMTVAGAKLEGKRAWLGALGRAIALVGLMAAFVPLLGLAPLVFALGLKIIGRYPVRVWIAFLSVIGSLIGAPFAVSRLGSSMGTPIPVPDSIVSVVIIAIALLIAMAAGSWRTGAVSAVMVFGGLVGARVTGPAVQEAMLVVAALGVGLAVAAALRSWDERGLVRWLSAGAGLVLLAVSLAGVAGGRAGMPPDEWGENLDFVRLGATGVERALLVATDPGRLPGDARPGPGLWYRVIDSRGATADQAILPAGGEGDAALDATLDRIISGAVLDPGRELSGFGVRWIIAVEEAADLLTPVLTAQVDMNPFPFADGLRVYDSVANRPVASTGEGTAWERSGSEFAGEAVDERIRLAVQGDSRWGPDWQAEGWAGTVDGSTGEAGYSLGSTDGILAGAGVVVILLGLGLAIWGRKPNR